MIKIACRACTTLNEPNLNQCPACGIMSPDKAPEIVPSAENNRIANWISWGIFLVVALALYSCMSSESDTRRVGREFSSMDQCLQFIRDDTGEALKIMSDKPGDVSGQTTPSKLFFRCEVMHTGTKGTFLQGRWDRAK